jgi:alpha-beta hydrolase superfamily lysophospholipase
MKSIQLSIVIIFLGFSTIASAQFDEKFYFPSKKLDSIKIAHTDYFIPVNTDTIHSILFETKKEPKGTILFFHGAGGNISSYMYMIEPLVENGYHVFAIDFRGYGKSTGKPTHINIASDVNIVFDEFKHIEATKNTKLIVYGASMGCQIATHFTKTHQKEIRGLILDGGFASFTEVALLSAPKEQHALIKQYVTSPYSAIEDIKDITALPTLFIHSNEDEIPMQQAELVFNNAQEPKRFLVYKGAHLEALKLETNKVIEAIDKLTTTHP